MTGVSNLAAGTWADAEAMVGRTIATLEGADPVSIGDIRRKLEVLGFDSPLHTDEACARAHGFRTVVSPCSMTRVWAMPPYWEPGQPRLGAEQLSTPIPATMVPGEGDTMIATQVRVDYLAPAYPGDRIVARAVLKSVVTKTTRVGPGAFLVVETTYTNQADEVIAIETATLLRYAQQPTTLGVGDHAEATVTTGAGAPAASPVAVRPARGERLEPFPVVITLQRLVMEAAANRDFAPIHFDPDAARDSGAPAVYVNTTFVETLLEALIRTWAGLDAHIRTIAFSLRAFNCVGDEIAAGGEVTSVTEAGDSAMAAELAVWVDGPRGRTVSGNATVELPR